MSVLGQTVTLSQQVTAVEPDFQAFDSMGQADFAIINQGTDDEQPFGMHLWDAHYTDPNLGEQTFGVFFISFVRTPSDFVSGYGTGVAEWCQLVTKLQSWGQNTDGTYQDVDNPFNGINKLDGSYPFLGLRFGADGGTYYVEDAPGMSAGGLKETYFTSTRQMYLNYTPPGSGSQIVSLARFDWWWVGHGEKIPNSTTWSIISHDQSCAYTSSFPQQPMWVDVQLAPTYHQRP